MYKILKKYKNLSLPLKAAFWFTICNFGLKGISFICMPLYTRLLPVNEYGKMSVIASYEMIFLIFATFELYLGAFQRGILKYKNDLKIFEQSIVLFSNTLSLICLVLVILFNSFFYDITGIPLYLYSTMTIYFIGYSAYNCWLNKKRFEYDYKSAVIVTLLMAIVSNFLPILVLNYLEKTAIIKVMSTLVLGTLFCVPFWIKDFAPLNLFKNRNKVKEYAIYAFKFQGPLIFHSLSYYILNQADRIMIGVYSDEANVAFYSVSYSLATVIILVQNSVNQALKPWRFKKLEEKKYEDVKNNSNILVVYIGIIILIFILIVPEVFKILFSQPYYEALICIPPVAISVYFLFLYTIFVDIESYYGKTHYIAFVSVFCALLNIVLNFIGLQYFNYVVCAYTTLISYIFMSLLHFVFMKKICKDENIKENPIDSKFIWLFSILILIIFFFINSFYNSQIFRYFILFLLLIIVFYKRKVFIEALKQK